MVFSVVVNTYTTNHPIYGVKENKRSFPGQENQREPGPGEEDANYCQRFCSISLSVNCICLFFTYLDSEFLFLSFLQFFIPRVWRYFMSLHLQHDVAKDYLSDLRTKDNVSFNEKVGQQGSPSQTTVQTLHTTGFCWRSVKTTCYFPSPIS
jgi:hypothetical protein